MLGTISKPVAVENHGRTAHKLYAILIESNYNYTNKFHNASNALSLSLTHACAHYWTFCVAPPQKPGTMSANARMQIIINADLIVFGARNRSNMARTLAPARVPKHRRLSSLQVLCRVDG